MLTQLKLSNFRLFDDEVTVRFRPITVFIGRNSSGKSSIVKFLLMLQQSSGGGRTEFLSPEGERVHLGAFSTLKNALTEKRSLIFELTSEGVSIPHTLSRHLEFPEDMDLNNLTFETKAIVPYEIGINTGVTGYSLIDGISRHVYDAADSQISGNRAFLDIIRSPNSVETEKVLEELDDIEDADQKIEFVESNLNELNKIMVEIDVLRIVMHEINSVRHLSPVREESERVIVAAPPPLSHVGQRGQYTLPHLQNVVSERRELYEFILPHLRNTVDIESIDFKASSGYVSQAFARNATTGANVHIADYGFGVSQCLPILVQGAIMPEYTTLMVEQPEAQLHPTAQLELGSFFADLWNRRRVGSIIETHSQNILLRLRRLVANGELNCEDVSIAYFTIDENRGNMPIVKNFDINKDGSLQSGLPMEFFGADIMEGLKLGARV